MTDKPPRPAIADALLDRTAWPAFAGSRVERTAPPVEIAYGARLVPFWQARPLIEDGQGLCWVETDDNLLADCRPEYLYIGMAHGVPHYAVIIDGLHAVGGEQPRPKDLFALPPQALTGLPETWKAVDLRVVMNDLDPVDAELAAIGKALVEWHWRSGYCPNCGRAMRVMEPGGCRSCPHCRKQTFPRVDPVVITLATHDKAVLVGRSRGWPDGLYSLLAGFVEAGETVEAAARRELFEEAGVRIDEIELILTQPWPFPSSLMIGCRGRADGRDLVIDRDEIEDARWVEREEMIAAFAGTGPIRPPRPGTIAESLITLWMGERL